MLRAGKIWGVLIYDQTAAPFAHHRHFRSSSVSSRDKERGELALISDAVMPLEPMPSRRWIGVRFRDRLLHHAACQRGSSRSPGSQFAAANAADPPPHRARNWFRRRAPIAIPRSKWASVSPGLADPRVDFRGWDSGSGQNSATLPARSEIEAANRVHANILNSVYLPLSRTARSLLRCGHGLYR